MVDEDTGNLILAMGTEGILTRTSTGEWLWYEEVSPHYKRAVINKPSYVISLLRIELILAIVLFFMVGGCASLWISPPKEFWQFMINIAGLAWLGIVISSPALNIDRTELTIYGLLPSPIWLLLVAALLIGFDAVIMQYQEETGRIITSSMVTSLLYLLPYILWSQNIIHKYTVAMIAALVLALGSAVVSIKELVRIHEVASEQADNDVPPDEQ